VGGKAGRLEDAAQLVGGVDATVNRPLLPEGQTVGPNRGCRIDAPPQPHLVMAGRWYGSAMRTTIDAAGRIVVPKAIREELALYGGEEVEVTAVDGRIEIEVPPNPIKLVERDGHLVAVPERPLPPLTVEMVRETLERVRR